MMERRSQPGALNGPEHFSQEPHHIHDKTIDASPWYWYEKFMIP
jgi:hypothetical protein